MLLKRIILILIKPWKWGILFRQGFLFFRNGIKYGNFSFNLNSKRYWNEKLFKLDHFWRNENYFHILDLLPKNSPFSLLDIGCALGDGCELLMKEFPKAKITGIDISEVGIEKARKKTKNVEYFVLDILKDSIQKKYDYISIIETLEHFDDPFKVVDKCLKYVKKALIISVPYIPLHSGKIVHLSEHRYYFNNKTFKNYKCRKIIITDFVKETRHKCIIYVIEP